MVKKHILAPVNVFNSVLQELIICLSFYISDFPDFINFIINI